MFVYPGGDANRMLEVFLLGCMAMKECALDYLMLGFSTLFGLITGVLPVFWSQTHFLPFPSFLLDCGTRDEPWTPALWNMDLAAGSGVLFHSETKFHKIKLRLIRRFAHPNVDLIS